MTKSNPTNTGGRPGWVDGTTVPYIIAEAGVNHNGHLSSALELVDAAWSVGADCVKFQAFSADELVVADAAKAEYQKACGQAGESQYDMLLRYELTEEDFAAIQQRCRQRGVDFLVTPFSPRWVNVFMDLNVNAFKVGSGNLGAPMLLDAIGRSGLPVILSTGMSDLVEVDRTLAVLYRGGCREVALMHCVSLYPTAMEQANLYSIGVLSEHTHLPVGFSDHTQASFTGGLAVAAGAVILEKHFTLDKRQDGPDHAMSMDPDEMREYIAHAKLAQRTCGTRTKHPAEQERAIKDAVRMSVVSTVAISAGSVLTREMLTEKRPGTGIPADDLNQLIGMRTSVDLRANQVLQSGDVPDYQRCSNHDRRSLSH